MLHRKRSSANLSEAEYIALINQKADDWRWISGVNPFLLGIVGALLAAGVTQQQAFVVTLSPSLLLLAVWHMTAHARLQQPMLTYLSNYAPSDHARWQRDWEQILIENANEAPTDEEDGNETDQGGLSAWYGRLGEARSAWRIWLTISWVVALLANLVVMAPSAEPDYRAEGWALLGGILATGVLSFFILRQAGRIDADKKEWDQRWRRRRKASAP